jgi:hypothetical protein
MLHKIVAVFTVAIALALNSISIDAVARGDGEGGACRGGVQEWVCAADDWARAAAESAVSTLVTVAAALVPAGDGGPGQATSSMPGARHTAIAGFATTQAGYIQESDAAQIESALRRDGLFSRSTWSIAAAG